MSDTLTIDRETASDSWHVIDDLHIDDVESVMVEESDRSESKSFRFEWLAEDRLSELIEEIDDSGQLDRAASLVARAWADRHLATWGDGLDEALAAGAAAYAEEDAEIAEQTLRVSAEDLEQE